MGPFREMLSEVMPLPHQESIGDPLAICIGKKSGGRPADVEPKEITGREQGEAGRGGLALANAPRQGNALGASSGVSHRVTVVQGR